MTTDPWRCRMFPLGSVLVPGAPLPLHIFEIRYQQMLNAALEDDRTFGVVLISRGHEVGGGDERTEVGTIAYIEEHQRFDDGRAAVMATGQRRIEVVEWLDDDPYPLAMVRDRPTLPDDADTDVDAAQASALDALETLLNSAVRLGRLDAIPELSWASEPETVAWQLAAMAPIEAFDRQRALSADRVSERFGVLESILRDIDDDLRLIDELG